MSDESKNDAPSQPSTAPNASPPKKDNPDWQNLCPDPTYLTNSYQPAKGERIIQRIERKEKG